MPFKPKLIRTFPKSHKAYGYLHRYKVSVKRFLKPEGIDPREFLFKDQACYIEICKVACTSIKSTFLAGTENKEDASTHDMARQMGSFDSFNQFIQKICTIPDHTSERHFRSQYWPLHVNGGPLAAFVGKFESLQENFAPIAQQYGLQPLPHYNKTESSIRWQDSYTPELAKLVYKRYKKDFDLWYPDAYPSLLNHLNNNDKSV